MRRKEYLGQSTIRLRRYGGNTSTEGSLRRKIGEKEKEEKNKVEEFQLANLASLGSLASKKGCSLSVQTNLSCCHNIAATRPTGEKCHSKIRINKSMVPNFVMKVDHTL